MVMVKKLVNERWTKRRQRTKTITMAVCACAAYAMIQIVSRPVTITNRRTGSLNTLCMGFKNKNVTAAHAMLVLCNYCALDRLFM